MAYLTLLHAISTVFLLFSMLQVNSVLKGKLTIHNLPYFLLGGLILFLVMKVSYILPLAFFIIGVFMSVISMIIASGAPKNYLTINKKITMMIMMSFGWAHFLAFLVYYIVNENKVHEKFKSGIDSL
jgi:hypothetical protein